MSIKKEVKMTFRWRWYFSLAAVLVALMSLHSCNAPAESQSEDQEKDSAFSSLPLRLIGPAYPSGRISDFAFFSGGHNDYLAATASGGLWRTTNAGVSWTPLFDKQGSYAIGVVEIAPSDEKIIWVGTGENNANARLRLEMASISLPMVG